MTQTQKWPEKMTKTRQEMNDLDLPWGGGEALVLQDNVTDQTRWSTIHELVFRLPDMPDGLAYRTTYSKGSTEIQDESPWEHGPAECVLVRKVPKVVETWTAEPVSKIPDLRAATNRKIREFVPGKWRESQVPLLAAENMTPEWHQRLQDNAGTRVRVRRVSTYEGDNTAVLQALAMSLPVGKTYGNDDCRVMVEEIEYGPIVENQPDTSSKDSAFEVRIVNGAKFTPRLSWFTDAARVFDERTGKILKDRNPEAPPCQVVVQYGPERSEFFVKRNNAEVDFNFGPLNRMINEMMDRLVKSSLNASEAQDADEP